MPTREFIAGLHERLKQLREAGAQYFANTEPDRISSWDSSSWALGESDAAAAAVLKSEITRFSVDVAGAARGAALVSEADLHDLRHNTRQMLASLRFNSYRHRGVYIHHDEGVVLGVDPPSQREEPLALANEARPLFEEAAVAVGDLIDLLSPSEGAVGAAVAASAYRPNTAFIMMASDDSNPDLQDVRNAIKEVFKEFGIVAITADEIEHDGVITDRILEEIETSEFLMADLTGEKPNVYYEVGHAHARGKRVILYRKEGAKLHFDVAHRNCPSYANLTELKKLLRGRLETLTNKPKKS